MDLRDRADAHLHVGQRVAREGLVRADRLLLEEDKGSDQRQRVGHAVVDLAQQRFRPLARFAHLALHHVLATPHPVLLDGRVDGVLQQLQENAADVLDDVVGRACLQRGDGDAPLVAAAGVDHRGRIGQGADLVQDFEPFPAGHEMVQRHRVEAARAQQRQAVVAALRQGDVVTLARERALHQAAECGVVIDVEDRYGRRPPDVCHGTSGTCMMERNRPSWRMAWEKVSYSTGLVM